MSASTATCGCCAGIAQRTPLEVGNRPGLSAIAYRLGVHADFLAAMIAGLTDADRPRLAALGTRERDDFSIALLDAWAVAADVLAFYRERLAQESYLRTARGRISLQELARLVGYRLRPGVAAQTYLAFAIEPPPDVPGEATRDPGAMPPVTPATVAVEPGLRVQSIPGPGQTPQTFETAEEVEARPEWNAFPASTTLPATGLGTTHAYLQGAALNLKPGDGLAIVPAGGAPTSWEFRTLADVDPEPEHGRTLVSWGDPLASLAPYLPPAAPPGTYVFSKRLSSFGHNAPHKTVIEGGTADWSFQLSAASGNRVDLDGSHPDVVEGSYVVLTKAGAEPRVWAVDSASELSRAQYAVSGKVTRLGLISGTSYATFGTSVREVIVFALSEPRPLAAPSDESDVAGNSLDVEVDVSAMEPGRRLLVCGTTTSGADHAEAAVVDEVEQVAGGWRITLVDDLSHDYLRSTLVIHGNVALATHGETVEQLLGSGRARDPFQRFPLAHEPLTHRQSTDAAAGAEAALEVRVNDVRWEEVPTLYGAGADDRAYALRSDETGTPYVQFGDGARGARLPSGSNNVRARYRKGLGATGNVGAGALAQLLDRPLGVKGVSNPAPASGGVDPEPEEAARASIPLGVRTLDRAVSVLDYEDFALAFAGVVKASATVLPLRGGRTIVVTVAFEGGERLDDLAAALEKHGDPRVEVIVLEGTTATFRIALKVAVSPEHESDAVLLEVEAALRTAYSFDLRGLGEPVFRSDLVAVAHRVAGVRAVDLDRLYTGTAPDLEDRLLAQRPEVDAGGAAIPAGVLVLDPAPFDWFEVIVE